MLRQLSKKKVVIIIYINVSELIYNKLFVNN